MRTMSSARKIAQKVVNEENKAKSIAVSSGAAVENVLLVFIDV